MADKKDKKEAEVVGIEIGGLIAIVVIIAAWSSILAYLQVIANALGLSTFFNEVVALFNIWGPQAGDLFRGFLNFIIVLSIPVSLFFLIGIIYSVEQLKHIRKKEDERYDVKVEPAYETNAKGSAILADRWEKVLTYVSSENPSDWRQAILDADIMLEDVLTTLGYQGEGIGEKLKRVEKGDMKTLNSAWEAHKVRNQIAHEGGFPLSKFEAQRVIHMYREVFEEFFYI